MSEAFIKIGSLDDFPPGSMKKVQVKGQDVVVAKLTDKVYALADTCTHRGCSLSEGEIEGTEVICPCHGGRFDLTTGKVMAAPPKKDVASYDVQVKDTNVLVKKR